MKLNKEQRLAFTLMSRGHNIFITGPGGCGKTSLLKEYIKCYKQQKKIGITSTTGTSALLINGTTLHSYTGIGLGKNSIEALITRIRSSKSWPVAFNTFNRWKTTQTLIIDEVSMLSADLFDKLEKIARIIRENNLPFGGIQLILSGDFCQLPCIGTNKFCFESESWEKCIPRTIYLTKIIRQKDLHFKKCLNEIRIGNISDETKQLIESRIDKKLINEFGIIPTVLYPLNKSVEHLNNAKLQDLSEETGFINEYNLDFVIYRKVNDQQREKYKKFCPAPDYLSLTSGCQVMLIHNLDIGNKLVNGSRGVVTGFEENLPRIKFLNGEERVIDYHIWEIEENDVKIGRIEQLPLKLGYAYSIHKCQGTSLDYAIMDLRCVFEHGMAYVALSRVKNLDGLSLKGVMWNRITTHPKALKFYKDLEKNLDKYLETTKIKNPDANISKLKYITSTNDG